MSYRDRLQAKLDQEKVAKPLAKPNDDVAKPTKKVKKSKKIEDQFDLDPSPLFSDLDKAALNFALHKCLNLFKDKRYNADSSPVKAFKTVWADLLTRLN